MANGAAMDARQESRNLQDLIQAKKRCEKKKKIAEDKAKKKSNNQKDETGWKGKW